MKLLNIKGFIKFQIFLAGIMFFMSACNTSYIRHYQQEVDSISAKYVPDQRVGICNIKIKQGVKKTLILTGETTNRDTKKEIIKTLDKKGISLVDSIIILPDTTNNKKYFGLVTLSVINLRKAPDHKSELVSQARMGTPVVILKNTGSWYLIQTPDNYISWTEESSVKLLSSEEKAAWKRASRVIYLDNTGWLYETPSQNSGVVSDVTGGCIMEKIGETNGYVSVILPDGRKGFVEKNKVLDFDQWKNTVECTGESICRVARTFIGIPYLWGGSSAKGADCSGFVQSVYFMNGVILQRDASLQALHGITVDISRGYNLLRKGDLLFFGSRRNGTTHVTHVAIYLGNNEYINSSGRVMVDSLDSTQVNYNQIRMSSILEAKRIIGVDNDTGIVRINEHPWY